MTRFVIGPDVALRLARDHVSVPDTHQLLAPALIRSQMLSLLYRAVRDGEVTKQEATRQLDFVRSLRLRLLGDRMLHRVAWQVADELDLPDTYVAEYVALTRLHADAFITLDSALAESAKELVRVASIEDLS